MAAVAGGAMPSCDTAGMMPGSCEAPVGGGAKPSCETAGSWQSVPPEGTRTPGEVKKGKRSALPGLRDWWLSNGRRD